MRLHPRLLEAGIVPTVGAQHCLSADDADTAATASFSVTEASNRAPDFEESGVAASVQSTLRALGHEEAIPVPPERAPSQGTPSMVLLISHDTWPLAHLWWSGQESGVFLMLYPDMIMLYLRLLEALSNMVRSLPQALSNMVRIYLRLLEDCWRYPATR